MFKSKSFNLIPDSEFKNLKLNRSNPSKMESTHYNVNNGFRFDNIRSFNADKSDHLVMMFI